MKLPFGRAHKPIETGAPMVNVASGSPVANSSAAHPDLGKIVPLCILLAVLVLWAFAPAISGSFLSYDDDAYVVSNVHVNTGLSWDNIAWSFAHGYASNWHPLTWISHMLDCQVYGLQPWGHHLTNVLLHTVNTLLVFLVWWRMTGALWRSFLVAALFGLHPAHVESVAWISERKDVLSALFWMLTLWAYVGYVKRHESRDPKFRLFYGLTLVFFMLGLLSKPMTVTLPCVLLLLDFWPLPYSALNSVVMAGFIARRGYWPSLEGSVLSIG